MTTPGNDFDAAKAVADQLKGLEKDRQHRILRWVAESLNLDLRLAGLAERGAGLVSAGPVAVPATYDTALPHRQKQPADIKSFVESKRPKSDVQFAAVVAYYYRFETAPENRKESINAEVLQDAGRLVGRRRPPKPLMTLNNAKNLGYLDSPERGQFRINTVGENLVAMTLPGGEAERSPKRVSRSSRPKRAGLKKS